MGGGGGVCVFDLFKKKSCYLESLIAVFIIFIF